MIARFCTYTTLRNMRLFEPFFVLYLWLGLDLSFVAVGALLAFGKVLIGVLETPLGAMTDRWGRRRGLMLCFAVTALAMVLFALAGRSPRPILVLYIAQGFYALGEALRSGTHKAIMFDWLDQQGRGEQASSVVALTRTFSKASDGLAALAGGVLIWLTGSFEPLFWLAAIPTLGVVVLIATYPRDLEGEWTREAGAGKDQPALTWRKRMWLSIAAPGVMTLVAGSVLFETQFKISAVYLQPYLAGWMHIHDAAVVGGLGAVAIGVYYFVQGLLAGGASSLGPRMERRLGGADAVLRLALGLELVAFAVTAASLWLGPRVPGVICLLLLACLQNARRPVFVSALNRVMDKYQRATTLSIESQARSWSYAVVIILTGWLAQAQGLAWVFLALALASLIGLLARTLAARLSSKNHPQKETAPPAPTGPGG